MSKYRKKPVVIEAHQWFKNGDHPFDYAKQDDECKGEGRIVRYFRHPYKSGADVCDSCGAIMHNHGWIDAPEDGHTVCPGDWIITMPDGKHYPRKPELFEKYYEKV